MVRRFTAEDWSQMASWYQKHDQNCPKMTVLPQIGFIEPGVAAGFLYRTDSDTCLIDAYISNPDISAEERDACLDEVTRALLEVAESQNYSKIMAITKSGAISRRAIKHGFRDKGMYSLFTV